MNNPTNSKKWNWLAALFQGAYYAGKGRFWKGLLYAILGIIPIVYIINFFSLGSKANEEIEDVKFNWPLSIFVSLFNIIGILFLLKISNFSNVNLTRIGVIIAAFAIPTLIHYRKKKNL